MEYYILVILGFIIAIILGLITVLVYYFITKKNYKNKPPQIDEINSIPGAKYFKITNRK